MHDTRNYSLDCITNQDAIEDFELFASEFAKFLIMMMILQSGFLLVLVWNAVRKIYNKKFRERLNWYSVS